MIWCTAPGTTASGAMKFMSNLLVLLVSLLAVESMAWWTRECCKCPNDDSPDGDFIRVTGGADPEDIVDAAKREDEAPRGDKAELLDLHNKYRRMVATGQVRGQPASQKIRDLVSHFEHEHMKPPHPVQNDLCRPKRSGFTQNATIILKFYARAWDARMNMNLTQQSG